MTAAARTRLAQVLAQAVEQGLLPAGTQAHPEPVRPWPVVLLTALGAWLAAIPLLLFMAMVFGPFFNQGAGPYLIAGLSGAAAVAALRSTRLPLFAEQLAVPALVAGLGSLAVGLMRDLTADLAAWLLALVCLGLAAALRPLWLRLLLGAAAAGLLMVTVLGDTVLSFQRPGRTWLAVHLAGALVLALHAAQSLAFGRRQAELFLGWSEAVACGAGLAVLMGLAAVSGMSFLVHGATGLPAGGAAPAELLPRGASALLALAATALAARAWPSLRRAPTVALGLLLAVLAAFMASLGAVLLALALAATTGRHRRAAAAALAAVWIIGAFYYALQWPLAQKSALLAGAGLLALALAGWWRSVANLSAARGSAGPAAVADEGGSAVSPLQGHPRLAWLLPATAVAAVALTATAVWQKEQLISKGRPSLVELAPVDPRSLMQGDYMALAYRLPKELATELARVDSSQRPWLVVRRDERNVLLPQRKLMPPAGAGALQPGEELIELSPKDGRWVIVTDAWFFKEGEMDRWLPARYAEFRLLPDGRALMVGLRDADLKPL
ncbi:MAG: GDYXXLXY domain-containing protein [Rubrivivax sp.]|nr:GDYXXLXY domain-containing protein [Rubrivivax sp.]